MGVKGPRPDGIFLNLMRPGLNPSECAPHVVRKTVVCGGAEVRCEVRVGYLSEWLSKKKGQTQGAVD